MTRTSKKVEKAYLDAQNLYQGLLGEDGMPIFDFIDHIYLFCRSENEKLVALLSEILNRNLMSEHDVRYTYGTTVCEAVKVLGCDRSEDDLTYLSRIKTNPISRAVKIAEFKYLLSIAKITQEDFDGKLDILIN